MNGPNPKNAPNNFESAVLKIPMIFGIPILVDDHENYDDCIVQFTLALFILGVSSLIIIMPETTSGVIKWLMSFSSEKNFLWKLVGSISANFVHSNVMHLLGNMYFYLVFAPLVEKKYGAYNFVIIFLFCSLVSNFGCLFFMKDFMSIGASGMISGLMGFVAITQPNLKFRFYQFIVLPGWLVIFLYFIIPNIIDQIRSASDTTHINYLAHIFGFIAGYAVTFLVSPKNEIQREWEIHKIKQINFSWLKSPRLWIELLISFLFPPIVFFMSNKHKEEYLLALANTLLIYKNHVMIAVVWAGLYVLLQHVKKSRSECLKNF
ncbi:MAG: rhomboid family intramembrane serine protease [Bdellovibrionales bacterium]|nr:rhomboid family intramembrane serine protease [Bdellovibrionales bacterium]